MAKTEVEAKSKGSNILFKIHYCSTILLMATGSALIAVCSLWDSSTKPYNYLIDPAPRSEVYTLLGLGVLLILLAILGILSAMGQNNCLLTTYSAVLTSILIIKAVIGSLLLEYAANPALPIGRNLVIELRKCENFSPFFFMFYQYQEELNCCGVGGPEDYRYNLHCWSRQTECYFRNTNLGCADAIASIVSYYTTIVAGFALGASILEALGCLVGCTLTIWIKKQL